MTVVVMSTRRQVAKKGAPVRIRMLTAQDIEAVIDIDARVTGDVKPEYWRRKLALYLSQQDIEAITASHYFSGIDPQLARVAEISGRVVGFIIGEIRSWEFGQPPTGWITALTVDRDVQRQGIGRRLLAEMLDYFRERGISTVRTMVAWSDGTMLSFFTAMGFDRGPFIELEKKIGI